MRPRASLGIAASLLATLAWPAGLAHSDSSTHPLPFNSALPFVDPGPSGTGVEGWYTGGAAAWVRADVGSPDDPLLAFSWSLCDMEVLGDGTGPRPEDESLVDGVPGGAMPDGLFNDGGIGAACHTSSWHYAYAPYNTPGCDYGPAYAADAVLGGTVWISTGCDSVTPLDSPSVAQLVADGALCLASAPPDPLGCLPSIACLSSGVGCPMPAAFACGADGLADSHAAGTGASGVPFTSAVEGCAGSGGEAAAVFVWDAVGVTVGADGQVVEQEASSAGHGWVRGGAAGAGAACLDRPHGASFWGLRDWSGGTRGPFLRLHGCDWVRVHVIGGTAAVTFPPTAMFPAGRSHTVGQGNPAFAPFHDANQYSISGPWRTELNHQQVVAP